MSKRDSKELSHKIYERRGSANISFNYEDLCIGVWWPRRKLINIESDPCGTMEVLVTTGMDEHVVWHIERPGVDEMIEAFETQAPEIMVQYKLIAARLRVEYQYWLNSPDSKDIDESEAQESTEDEIPGLFIRNKPTKEEGMKHDCGQKRKDVIIQFEDDKWAFALVEYDNCMRTEFDVIKDKNWLICREHIEANYPEWLGKFDKNMQTDYPSDWLEEFGNGDTTSVKWDIPPDAPYLLWWLCQKDETQTDRQISILHRVEDGERKAFAAAYIWTPPTFDKVLYLTSKGHKNDWDSLLDLERMLKALDEAK